MTSSDRRVPSKKSYSNKTAGKIQFLNVLPSVASRGSPMPANRFRSLNYVPKLTKNSQEKILFIQTSGGKIFIAIVSKHCKKFNFALSFFFFFFFFFFCFLKASKIVFMLYFNQFIRPVLNWVFCAINILLLILMFPNA